MAKKASTLKKCFFRIFSVILFVFCFVDGVFGLENIANGKKYKLSPAPNYIRCTDPDDITQLTDGVFSKGLFWTATTTVGWNHVNPASIEIDLDSISPISGIAFNTSAGSAGVRWPKAIYIFVSNDAHTYRYVGDLMSLNQNEDLPAYGSRVVRRIWTNNLHEHGRYVRLAVIPDKSRIHVDEIEVFEGVWSEYEKAERSFEIEDVDAFIVQLKLKSAISKRLRQDIYDVMKKLDTVENADFYRQQLEAVLAEIPNMKDVNPEPFQTCFPINELHERIFGVQAALWRAQGMDEVTVWQKNKWDMMRPSEEPNGGPPTIELEMMRNEYRNAAFNLTITRDTVTELSLKISGLPGGSNPSYITVHKVDFTDTYDGIPVMAALPEVSISSNGYHLTLYPGITCQVWLTFDSGSLAPGEYKGSIEIEGEGIVVPVALKVYPMKLPDKLALHLGGWDFTDRVGRNDLTLKNRDALTSVLQAYKVDTPWASSAVFGRGKYDADGNMVSRPDIRKLDSWLRRWPEAEKYFVSIGANESFCGLEIGTDAFKTAVGQWITYFVKVLAIRNIRPEQLGLLLVDEPRSIEQYRIVIAYAEAIKAAQPSVLIFEDVLLDQPWKAPQEMFELSDIQCINWPGLWLEASDRFVDFYMTNQATGKKIWFYSCRGPGRLMDPYTYFYLPSWSAWKQGAEGISFWAFGDSNGASSWNEYLATTHGSYTPLFLDEDSVTSGKQMEAIREGREDYEYLKMLKTRIDLLETQNIENDKIDAAKSILSDAVDSVTSGITEASIRWDYEKNRSGADTARINILDALMLLETP